MGTNQDNQKSVPGFLKNTFLKRFMIILSLFVLPGSIPVFAYSRAKRKGMSRGMTLLITSSLLILLFLVSGFTWAF